MVAGAIEVGAIQAEMRKSNYLTNALLGEAENIIQSIIKNSRTLNSHKYK